MALEFKVAAKAAAGEEEDVVEVPIDDVTYIARRPTPAMFALFQVESREDYLGALWHILQGILGKEAVDHIKTLIWERRIDLDDLVGGSEENEDGLLNMIISEFSGRPTEPSTDSSASPKTGGRKSTRAPGKGSISSTSGSTDS